MVINLRTLVLLAGVSFLIVACGRETLPTDTLTPTSTITLQSTSTVTPQPTPTVTPQPEAGQRKNEEVPIEECLTKDSDVDYSRNGEVISAAFLTYYGETADLSIETVINVSLYDDMLKGQVVINAEEVFLKDEMGTRLSLFVPCRGTRHLEASRQAHTFAAAFHGYYGETVGDPLVKKEFQVSLNDGFQRTVIVGGGGVTVLDRRGSIIPITYGVYGVGLNSHEYPKNSD